MSQFIIEGSHTLKGSIDPQGAKNEALQILCAVLLTDEEVTVYNIPNIRDCNKLIQILRLIGVQVVKLDEHSYRFKADTINLDILRSSEYTKISSEIRASIMLLGPLLGRFKKAYTSKPGGDKIGRRPIDIHINGFKKLGVHCLVNGDFIELNADPLRGSFLLLEEPSVTGTANILMASVLAVGKTIIFNAACEPYIVQLSKMLISMGAQITGVGSNLLVIEGVEKLHGCIHTMLPDMIEIGSFIGLAAMTGSELTIKNVSYENLGNIPHIFSRLGIKMEHIHDDIYIPAQDYYEVDTFMDGSILTLYDAPWPGFTPDLISIVLVTAIQAKGSVLIHQKMFESRLFFVDKLIDMGAQIILCDPHRATVIGLNHAHRLRGTIMSSPDIRAGVALLIAALSAKGQSIIQNIEQIDRGYEAIDERLRKLGAHIQRG